MKTKKDIKKINFNDYAFFKNVSVLDAKWAFAKLMFKPGEIGKNTTKSGAPKIGVNDYLEIFLFDFSIRSNSLLDGSSQFDYLCDYYNRGIPINSLREFSENKGFIKAIKFTGKHSIVNDILNPEQLLKLQRTWLIKNFEFGITTQAVKFEASHDWAMQHMYESGIDIDMYEKAKKRMLAPKDSLTAGGYSFQS